MADKGVIGKEEKKKQFCWTTAMSHALLKVLADLVRSGNRPNNTFKTSSFALAAKTISKDFNVQCLPDHVDNHLKTLRTTWNNICKIKDNSGFGWEEELKKITAPEDVANEYLKQYPAHERYLNKKIAMYDELSIVVGKDTAKGNYAKSFADVDVDVAGSSVEPSKSLDTIASKSESETSSQPREHRKRARVEDEPSEIQHISEQLGEVVSALKTFSANQLDINKLYDEIIEDGGL